MDEEEKALLEEKIIEVYKIKNITFDDKSLFNKNKKFKNERLLREKLTKRLNFGKLKDKGKSTSVRRGRKWTNHSN